MTTKLKDHVSTIETTCKSVCDKFDIKSFQIIALQRKRVASLEFDIHSLKKSRDTLTSLILQQALAQASTNAKVEVIYKKLNEAKYNVSASTSTPTNSIPVIDESLRVDISNMLRQHDSMGSIIDTL